MFVSSRLSLFNAQLKRVLTLRTSSVPNRGIGLTSTKFLHNKGNSEKRSGEKHELLIPKELDVLKPVNQIHLEETRHDSSLAGKILSRTLMGRFMPSSVTNVDVSDKNKRVLLNIKFSSGARPQENKLEMYSRNSEKSEEDDKLPLLGEVTLDHSRLYKSWVLTVKSPPGNIVAYAHELPGPYPVILIGNIHQKTQLQILPNADFGWVSSAKILNKTGDKQLGTISKNDGRSQVFENALKATIYIPPHLGVYLKLSLISSCIFMVR